MKGDTETRSEQLARAVSRFIFLVPYLLGSAFVVGAISTYYDWQVSQEYGTPFPGLGNVVGGIYLILVAAFVLPAWWKSRHMDER